MTTHSPALIWLLIGIIAGGTWLLRISFLAILGRAERVPLVVERVLRLIPAAVMTAIIIPTLSHPTGTFDPINDRMAAGIIAFVVAWKTRNVLATIGTGMAVLWILQALT